jgi:hypothetical protein
MKRRVLWAVSRDRFLKSKCGRFTMSPIYAGQARPVGYVVYDTLLKRQIVGQVEGTQSEAKASVENFLDSGSGV